MNASLSIHRTTLPVRFPARPNIFAALLALITSIFSGDDPAALRYARGD